MSSDYSDSQNPSSSTTHDLSKSSSSSSSKSSSIDLSADFLQQSTNRIQQSAQALNALVGKLKSTQRTSWSHPTKDSSLEHEPGVKILIPHDQAHYTYILGPLCTKHPLCPHIIESFILPNSFKLPIVED